MPRKTLEQLLEESNARLKSGNCPLRLSVKGSRISLRGTLPPRPDSNKDRPYQQRIPIGKSYNPAGIKKAEKLAHQISDELQMGTFDWNKWLHSERQDMSISHWVKAFEKEYFTRRDRNPKSETTWAKDYQTPFRKLPQDVDLTSDVLVKTAKSYPPDTRSRKRACTAYSALAKLAGIDIDLTPLRGSYRPSGVRREDVPSDMLILEWCDLIPDKRWRTFYQLCACYGLRNHEAFYIDLPKLAHDPIATVEGGKTGYRPFALPCPKSWWEQWFKGQTLELPALKASANIQYGTKTAQYFNRLELPFHIYDLRHAHAARLAISGIDPAIAARSQGHSLKVHSDIYLNFLEADNLRGLLDRL